MLTCHALKRLPVVILGGLVAGALLVPWATAGAAEGGPGADAAAGGQARFNLRADSPDVGSNLPRRLVTGSLIPFDKPWEGLTPAQQRLFASQYEAMGPGDEPPFPRRGLQSIYRAFDRTLEGKLFESGALTVEVVVDSDGMPQEVRVLASPDREATRAMAAVLLAETFKPARCAGKPCKMAFPVQVELVKRLL